MEDVIIGLKSWSSRAVRVTALAAIIAPAIAACGSESSPVQPNSSIASFGTLAADCEQLVGGQGLVSRALAYTHPEEVVTADPYGNTDDFRFETQDVLARIVFAGDRRLADPVGQLVDFLDDPPAYLRSEDLTAKVQSAGAKIRKICAG